MVKVPNMLVENKDFELIPGDEEHWYIRILTGEYIETVMSFGKISVDEKTDVISFDVTIHYSPDLDLTVDDLDFQKHAGKVLEGILIENLNQMETRGKH